MFSSKKKTGFSKFVASIPNGVWIIISLAAALLLWVVISHTEKGGVVFATPPEVVESLISKIQDGTLLTHIGHSLFRVIVGFSLGFVASIPVAFLMVHPRGLPDGLVRPLPPCGGALDPVRA